MADRFQGPGYRGYNDPAIANGFEAMGKAFAPPSLADIYAGAKAKEAQQKMQGVAAMYGLADSADMSPEAKIKFDRYNAATGSGPISTGYYGTDQKNITDQRGQDVTARTSIQNNNADNKTKTDIAMIAPVSKDATRFVPPSLADQYKVAPTQTGVVEIAPGGKAFLPGAQGPGSGGTLEGNAKPLTEAEMKAKIMGELPKDTQQRVVAGEHPAQVFNYKTLDGKGGPAAFDPVTGSFVDSQTRQPLPPGVAIHSAGAPATQVNIDSSGNSLPPPEKGYGYVRDADGKVKTGANGAPMLAPMEGGAEFHKLEKEGKAGATAEADKGVTNDIMTQDIDRALATIKANPALATGLGAQALNGVGGTDAANLHALLDGLKSNISLERLQALRDSSPTGAALGRVTNQEINLLAAGHGSLGQSQSAEQLADNLKRIKNLTLDTVHGKGQGPARESLGFQQPTAEEAAAELARRRGAVPGAK